MTNFTDKKATELREMVKANDAALAALTVPVSRAKKDELVAALEAATEAPKKGGRRSFTDEQAEQVVYLRHEELQSWRQIANRLRLGSPGVARRAYRHATGCEGVLPRIAGKSGRPTAGMVAGTEKPEVLGAAPQPKAKAKAAKAAKVKKAKKAQPKAERPIPEGEPVNPATRKAEKVAPENRAA